MWLKVGEKLWLPKNAWLEMMLEKNDLMIWKKKKKNHFDKQAFRVLS